MLVDSILTDMIFKTTPGGANLITVRTRTIFYRTSCLFAFLGWRRLLRFFIFGPRWKVGSNRSLFRRAPAFWHFFLLCNFDKTFIITYTSLFTGAAAWRGRHFRIRLRHGGRELQVKKRRRSIVRFDSFDSIDFFDSSDQMLSHHGFLKYPKVQSTTSHKERIAVSLFF